MRILHVGLLHVFCDVQLETIYVLEGLGPPKDHVQRGKSFKDQVCSFDAYIGDAFVPCQHMVLT